MQKFETKRSPSSTFKPPALFEGEALKARVDILCKEARDARDAALSPKERACIAIRATVLQYFASLIEAGQVHTSADLAATCREHTYNFARDFLAQGSLKAVTQNMLKSLPESIFENFSKLELQQGISFGIAKSALWGEALKERLSILLDEVRNETADQQHTQRSKLLVRSIVLDYLAQHPEIDSTLGMEKLFGIRSRYLANSFLKIGARKPLTSMMAEKLPLHIFLDIPMDDLYRGIQFSAQHTLSAQVHFAKKLNDFALRVEGSVLKQKKPKVYNQLVTRSEVLGLLGNILVTHPRWTLSQFTEHMNAGQPYDAQISHSMVCKLLHTRYPITHHMAAAIERLSGTELKHNAGIFVTKKRPRQAPRLKGAALIQRIELIKAECTDDLRSSALSAVHEKACQLMLQHTDNTSEVHIRSLASQLNVDYFQLQHLLSPSCHDKTIAKSLLVSLNNTAEHPLHLVNAPSPQAPLREEKYFARLKNLLEKLQNKEQGGQGPIEHSYHLSALRYLLDQQDKPQGIRSAADLARRSHMSKSQVQQFLSSVMLTKAVPSEVIALLPESYVEKLHKVLATSQNQDIHLICSDILHTDSPHKIATLFAASLEHYEKLDVAWLRYYMLMQQLCEQLPQEAQLVDRLALMKQSMTNGLREQSQSFERTILNKGFFFQDRWTKLMSEPIQVIAAINHDEFPVFCALKLQRLNELLEKDHRGQLSQLYLAERSRGEARLTMQFLAAVGYTYEDIYKTYAESLHATIAAYKQIMFLDIRGYALSVSDKMPPLLRTASSQATASQSAL
jgi:hypothetical protein